MNEHNYLKDIPLKLEDVSIYIHDIRIQLFTEAISTPIEERFTAYTNVWHAMVVHRKEIGCELVGDLSLMFRNQGNDFSSIIQTFGIVRAYSEQDNNPRSVFTKLVQCLFEWMKEYCDTNGVRDAKSELFVLPEFGYSKDVFKNLPVE